MKMLTYAAIIALGTASAAFAQSNQSAPANTPTSPDQSVTTNPQHPMPQHSGAASSPAGMGGPNAAAPMHGSHAASSASMHRSHHRMSSRASARGSGQYANSSNDHRENEITAQLNQQQLANNDRVSQTANRPNDCNGDQAGCAPHGHGGKGVGPMP